MTAAERRWLLILDQLEAAQRELAERKKAATGRGKQ
jgi:hypothetical protein